LRIKKLIRRDLVLGILEKAKKVIIAVAERKQTLIPKVNLR
jgi:hypothetical protein